MDLCGILPYKRMYPYLCGRIIYYCISSPLLYNNQYTGPNMVCKDQLNRARVCVFSGSMSAISISQRKCKRLSNMDHDLGSLTVGIKKGTFTVFVPLPPLPPHTHQRDSYIPCLFIVFAPLPIQHSFLCSFKWMSLLKTVPQP